MDPGIGIISVRFIGRVIDWIEAYLNIVSIHILNVYRNRKDI